MTLLFLFAQNPDPISGGAGWVGAGLLGLVLGWLLLKHLPDKDKQIRELLRDKDLQLADRDAHVKSIVEHYETKMELLANNFRAESKEVRAEFKMALSSVTSHCEKEMSRLIEAISNEMKKLHPGTK